MTSNHAVTASGLILSLFLPLCSWADGGVHLNISVDATELSQKLLHAKIEIPTATNALVLWYPKWIPGIHAPKGPVQNIGGLEIEASDGTRIDWKRDEEEPYRFLCDLPEGATAVSVSMDYICNQPSVNSIGVDSFGNSQVGIINWNTTVLYPEGFESDDIQVTFRLKWPKEWRFGTALEQEKEDGDWIEFKTTTLTEFIDSPIIGGKNFRTIDLSTDDFPPHFLHMASESAEAIEIEEELIEKFKNLVKEGKELFGEAHFPAYHFLLVLSDELPNMGLEHLASSLNGISERDLIDEKKQKGWPVYLLPHEYVHSWCGKYRRPAGMATPDYQTNKLTRDLWIYEGLTQYLGEILTARSELNSFEDYLDKFTTKVDYLMRQKGRRWRSLRDTAVATYLLRGHSPNWQSLRRGQDYYNEGLLNWLQADAMIRKGSDGRHGFDDFSKKFFGRKEEGVRVLPFTTDEIYEILNSLWEHDWEEFFEKRIEERFEELPLEVIGLCGYQFQYSPEPSEYLKEHQEDRKYVTALDSLGLNFNEKGSVTKVVPDMPGEKAGIAPGMKVQGINGRKFSRERVTDALAESITRRNIEFLVLEGDRFETITVDYSDGPKYLKIVRDEKKRDILKEILKPQVKVDEE